MSEKHSESKWVVVEVRSGIPVAVEAFTDRLSAERYEQTLRDDMNPENDEVGVFEIQSRSTGKVGD
jgi:hypothetical protein